MKGESGEGWGGGVVRTGWKSVTSEEVGPETDRWRDDGCLITCRDSQVYTHTEVGRIFNDF